MPIRVRCRCGQELILRYGDWVYVFLGLALFAVVVNSLVLVLLYLRLEEVRESTRPVLEAPATSRAADRAFLESAKEREKSPGGSPAEGSRSEADGSSGAKPDVPAEKRKESAEGPGTRPLRRLRPLGDSEGLEAIGSPGGRTITPELFANAPASSTEAGATAPGPEAASEPEPVSEGSPGGQGTWCSEPGLLRLLLLESGFPPEAFLSDPDPWIRKTAIRKSLQAQPEARSILPDGSLEFLIEAARPWLEKEAEGGALLRLLGVGSSRGPREAPPELSGFLQARVQEILLDPSRRALRDCVRGGIDSGVEVVLLVDVTLSMKPLLERFREECPWIVRTLEWVFPGSRLGVVLYRDAVERIVGFEEGSSAVVRVVREARAEGGGDVTEGLHLAFRAALSLGRLKWRAGASKHLVVFADAPPPYPERYGVLSLARGAYRQGAYRTHAIYGEQENRREKVSFFVELARGGGGIARKKAPGESLGEDFLSALFSESARETLQPLFPVLRELASLDA